MIKSNPPNEVYCSKCTNEWWTERRGCKYCTGTSRHPMPLCEFYGIHWIEEALLARLRELIKASLDQK
jgi:hypothetical protein